MSEPMLKNYRSACLAGLCALGLLAAAPPAAAVVGGLPTKVAHDESSPEWEKLRDKLFQARRIESANAKVQLIVPLRAAYGASVPVKIVSRLPQTA
jgi:sulfur-oxidizing protein SoxY